MATNEKPVVKVVDTLLYSVFSAQSEIQDDFIPDDNREYKSRDYWDKRFSKEASYEWLCTFAVAKAGFEKCGVDFSQENIRVLVVGCGNSNFSKDLSVACPTWKVTSIDFSNIVVDRMRKKCPELNWIEMDMTNMTFENASFDLVLDKAAMDALVADEGSSWDPSESSCKSVDDMVASCARVLKPGGLFSIVSFQPTHFRRRHLERAATNCNKLGSYLWNDGIRIIPVENPSLGTEFSVFTLARSV